MYQEDPRPFQAAIPDEIRDRALAPSRIDLPTQTLDEHHTALRELGMLAAGTGLVVGAVVLGAVAGLVIAGAVIVLLARSLVESDRP